MKGKYITDSDIKLSEAGKACLSSKRINKNTLLMSFKLTLGKTAFAGTDLYTNEAICGLIPKDKSDKSISEYLFWVLPLIDYTPYAQRAAKGYTLNKELIPTIEIPFPDKQERNKTISQIKRMSSELERKKQRLLKEIHDKELEINDFVEATLYSN